MRTGVRNEAVPLECRVAVVTCDEEEDVEFVTTELELFCGRVEIY